MLMALQIVYGIGRVCGWTAPLCLIGQGQCQLALPSCASIPDFPRFRISTGDVAAWPGGTQTFSAYTSKSAALASGGFFIGSIITATTSGVTVYGANDGGSGNQTGFS